MPARLPESERGRDESICAADGIDAVRQRDYRDGGAGLGTLGDDSGLEGFGIRVPLA